MKPINKIAGGTRVTDPAAGKEGCPLECMYCRDNDFRRSLMEFLCDLPHTAVYVMRDQRYYGRCVAAFRDRHAQELYELTPEELTGYMADVARVAQAVQAVSGAAKINYAIYGDIASHVHFHIVPKQRQGDDWGGPFRMDGEPVPLSGEAWTHLREQLLERLSEVSPL